METEYAVGITPGAREQMAELLRYIAENLQAPGTAIKALDLLKAEIYSLSLFPSRFALTEEEPWHSMGVRKMPVKNYLVYYLVDNEALTVDVTAVINGRRDQLQQLTLMELE